MISVGLISCRSIPIALDLQLKKQVELLNWDCHDYIEQSIEQRKKALEMENVFLEENIRKLEIFHQRLHDIHQLEGRFVIRELLIYIILRRNE